MINTIDGAKFSAIIYSDKFINYLVPVYNEFYLLSVGFIDLYQKPKCQEEFLKLCTENMADDLDVRAFIVNRIQGYQKVMANKFLQLGQWFPKNVERGFNLTEIKAMLCDYRSVF